MKIIINPFTGLPQLVGDGGGGGGGDGVKKINGKSPDSTGNYVIKADDIPPAPLEVFISDTVAKTNHAYAAIDSKNTLTLQLPPRGTFKRSDILEVENLSATAFKITLNTDLLIRYDNTVIEDTDGRFLLSEGPGSSIKLRAESTQLWYVVRRDRVKIASSEVV